MFPGIHVSAAGGSVRALERAELLSLEAAQIFTSNQTRWNGRQIERTEWVEFRERRSIPVISHGSYLINLSSDRNEVSVRSREALRMELKRMELLGLDDLVKEGYERIGKTVRPMGEAVGAGLTEKAAGELGLRPGTAVGVSIIDAHAGGLGLLGAPLDGQRPAAADMERRLALLESESHEQ